MAKRSSQMQRAADMCLVARYQTERILAVCGLLEASMDSDSGANPQRQRWAIQHVVDLLEEDLLEVIDEIRSDVAPTPRPTAMLKKRRKQEAPA